MWFASNTPKNKHQASAATELAALGSDGIHLTTSELLRLQRHTHLLRLTPRHAIQTKLAGNYLAKSKGRGMEFDEVRHYQHGDDIRSIDWRVTARTGETYTKLFREEKERPVFILTDLTRNMQFGSSFMFKSVMAAHLASLIAWSAREKGDRLGGIVCNSQEHKELKPRSRQHGVLHYLHALVDLQNRAIDTLDQSITDNAFADACSRLRRVARPGSSVYVISDFSDFDDNAQHHLAQLSQHCELVAVQISDPLEMDLPTLGFGQHLGVTDGDTKATLSAKQSQAWHDDGLAQLQRINKALTRCRARTMHISAAQTLQQQLSGTL